MVEAIFFDLDGVIVDTEKDGHRVAFNRAFAEFGVRAEWDIEQYRALVKVGGGKERMASFFDSPEGRRTVPGDPASLIPQLHARKTEIFVDLVSSGALPLRPGVARFMHEARSRGVRLAICTTSNEASARAIVARLLADIDFEFILAGDVVPAKKPNPAIYLLALQQSRLPPERCLVVEDSRNGVLAARSAGLRVLATVNEFTADEDFDGVDAIVTSLGDRDGVRSNLVIGPKELVRDGEVTIDGLAQILS